MRLQASVRNETEVASGYRANRTRSLFNVEDERGAKFELDLDLDLEEAGAWQIGLVVGPSGSGKSSVGRELVRGGSASWWNPDWSEGSPIVECIGTDRGYDEVTGALAAVGLGDVPAWLRPYRVLSQGEQFRASLAKLCVDGGSEESMWVVDEFTSVVDRQIARIGSMAFAKTWRRGTGQVVLLSCHHDIVPWLVPDWCYDTGTGELTFPKAQGSQDPELNSKSGKPAGPTGTCLSRIII